MLVTFDVSKFETSMKEIFSNPLNIFDMSVTLEVLNLLTSKLFKEKQLENIKEVSTTFEI